MKHHHRMLVLAFFLPLVAIGVPYFQGGPYALRHLVGLLVGWPLVLVFFGAVASRLAGAGVLVAWGVAGITIPLLVVARIVRDTATGSFMHDMWPLELAIAGALGFGIALLGALAGHFAIKLRTPR